MAILAQVPDRAF